MFITVYFVGYIVAYILIKKKVREGRESDWSDIGITFALSILSWVMVLIVVFFLLREEIIKIKPPEWL
jgi:hypothetical protein